MKSRTDIQKERMRDLRALYRERKERIRSRLEDFSNIHASQFFYELVYCLLTPQSAAAHAEQVVRKLQELDFEGRGFDPESMLRNPAHYIRFHATKARHLVLAREQFGSIRMALGNGHTAVELREWLVKHVKGLGYKEASHFLRNIGKNGGLAILDRHILKNLRYFGVIASVPDTLSKKKYFEIEGRFMHFARRVRIPLDELDLLFWSMETGEIRK